MDEATRYPQIFKYVTETPWAILPSALVRIREILAFKAAGGTFTAEELEERIGAAKPKAKPASGGAIAVLPIQGVIVPHADLMTEISGGTSIDGFLARLRDAVADKSVSTIVLDIDSPGGSVELLAEAAAEIRAARKEKEVVAVANAFAASAAYYLMAQASQAIATPSGQVGSIGTIAIHQDLSKALEMEGVDPTIITYGEFKAETHPFQSLSEEAEAELQRMVDSYGREFVADVAKGRGISTSKVENEFGQGRMLRPEDALAVGMIDGISSFDEVIANLLGGRPATRRTRAEEPELELAAAHKGATRRLEVSIVGDGSGLALPSLTSTTPGGQIGAGPTGATPSSGRASARSTTHTDERKEVSTMEATDTAPNEGQLPRTREEIVARMDEITARQEELNVEYAGRLMQGDDLGEFNELVDEYAQLETILEQMDTRARLIRKKADDGSAIAGDSQTSPGPRFRSNVETRKRLPENVFALEQYRVHARSLDDLEELWKEGARRVADGLTFEAEDQDAVQTRIGRLIDRERSQGRPSESFAHRVLLTGSQAYDRAFGKMVTGQQLTAEEDRLIRAAVSHTGLGAETPVPVTIDPTVLLTSDGQANPLRAISDVRSITGKTWRGINSDGVVVEYDAELAALDDTTPTFDAPEADVHKAQAEIQLSLEVDADWPGLRAELAMMLNDAKDAKEAEKFLLGTGVNEPEGLIFALEDDGTSIVFTATMDTFAPLTDVFALRKALPPRWRARAAYLANDAVYDEVRIAGADDVGPNAFWVDMSGDTPARLLGKPAYEASEMSDGVDTGGETIMVYGDFSRGFLIIDRVGMNVINAGLVRNGDGKLIGATAIYAYWRNTSKLRTPKAFRALAVSTS